MNARDLHRRLILAPRALQAGTLARSVAVGAGMDSLRQGEKVSCYSGVFADRRGGVVETGA